MSGLDLADLIAPLTPANFFKDFWPGKPLFLEPHSDKLKPIFRLNQLQDIDSLLAARHLKVRACLPDFDDEFSSVLLDPKDAAKAYRNNLTLVFDSMQTQSLEILQALLQIRSDLGLATGGEGADLTRARALAYATPAGGQTRLHFDANANFVVQVKGSKRWSLAPNNSVKNPTERYTSGTGEVDAVLETQCHAKLLHELPDDGLQYLLTPGCVLFVPRGYWHETTTEEDSLSLNFTYSQPTWADIFTKSIYQYLLKSAEWRELADGLESLDSSRKQKATDRFKTLLNELTLALPKISAEALLTIEK